MTRRKILGLSNQTMRYRLPVAEDFLHDLEGEEKTHIKNFCVSVLTCHVEKANSCDIQRKHKIEVSGSAPVSPTIPMYSARHKQKERSRDIDPVAACKQNCNVKNRNGWEDSEQGTNPWSKDSAAFYFWKAASNLYWNRNHNK